MNTDTMNIAIYARVSKHDQETDNQLIELRELCKRQGWNIHKEYIDIESGGVSNRKAFKNLFTDANQRKFDCVLFWALDRFSREGTRETLHYLNQLESYGVSFKSFTEPYMDSAGIFKDAIIAIMATLAKQERVRISERTKSGLQRAKAKGQKLGRPALSKSKQDEILSLKKQGLSVRKIAKKVGVSIGVISKIKHNT